VWRDTVTPNHMLGDGMIFRRAGIGHVSAITGEQRPSCERPLSYPFVTADRQGNGHRRRCWRPDAPSSHLKQVGADIWPPSLSSPSRRSGFIVPAEGFLPALLDWAGEQRGLIADEVQTGSRGTGAMFACEHEASNPT